MNFPIKFLYCYSSKPNACQIDENDERILKHFFSIWLKAHLYGRLLIIHKINDELFKAFL